MPLRLVLADIMTLQTDARVNPANSELEPGGLEVTLTIGQIPMNCSLQHKLAKWTFKA
jgi:hypothetical protein